MAFSDPIVGTEVLIRNQIQSENFSVDPIEGVSGWQIKRDGTATFNQLVIGSPNFSIDANGDVVFHSITLTADSTETGIILHGEDIDPELYNHKAKGVVAFADLNNSTGSSTGTTGLISGRIIVPAFDTNRYYRVCLQIHLDTQAVSTSYMGYHIRYAWDADPTTSSPILVDYQMGGRNANTDEMWASNFVFRAADLGTIGTDLRLLVDVFSSVAGIRVQGETWNRLWVEDAGELVTETSYDLSGAGGSPPQQYTKTYSTTGTASYQSDGDKRTGIAEGYQGEYSSTNGNQFSWYLFSYSTIASDLAGSTINKVEVYLKNKHWYYNSGGTAVIGYHNSATLPDPATYPSSTDNITQSSFTYGQAKWVTVSNTIGNAFRDGTAKGIMLGKGPNNDNIYYGYFAGNGQTGEMQLRITYTK